MTSTDHQHAANVTIELQQRLGAFLCSKRTKPTNTHRRPWPHAVLLDEGMHVTTGGGRVRPGYGGKFRALALW